MIHTITYLTIDGLYPASACSCGRYGYTFTRTQDDTRESVKQRLDDAHRKHIEEENKTQGALP